MRNDPTRIGSSNILKSKRGHSLVNIQFRLRELTGYLKTLKCLLSFNVTANTMYEKNSSIQRFNQNPQVQQEFPEDNEARRTEGV